MYNTPICSPVMEQSPSLVERLKERKNRLEQELQRIDSAIISVETNPDLANIVESLRYI